MVVVGGLLYGISVEDETSVTLMTFVPDAQPVRSLPYPPLTSVDEVGMYDEWRTALAADEGPRQRSFVLVHFVSLELREVQFYHF